MAGDRRRSRISCYSCNQYTGTVAKTAAGGVCPDGGGGRMVEALGGGRQSQIPEDSGVVWGAGVRHDGGGAAGEDCPCEWLELEEHIVARVLRAEGTIEFEGGAALGDDLRRDAERAGVLRRVEVC